MKLLACYPIQRCEKHRFTYNGFLTCSECGEIIHTTLARRGYYTCKGRRVLHSCRTRYMGREKLEGLLDTIFSGKLTNPEFIENCLLELQQRTERQSSATSIQKLGAEVDLLRSRRSRVIDSFVDGMIEREERDRRLAACDRDIQLVEQALLREAPTNPLDPQVLIETFAALVEWEHWTRDQKRLVLATLVPDIRVADYKVESLGLNPALFSNESTRLAKGNFIAEQVPHVYLQVGQPG